MKKAILGGTGRIGEGLATRWAPAHEIYIGSKDVEKAKNAELSLIEGLRSVLNNKILLSSSTSLSLRISH